MLSINVKKEINAPRQVVFERATDLGAWAEQISAIERVEVLTDGPVGVGTRFKETRTMFKREATEEMTFVEFDPPNRYAVDAHSCGSDYHTVFEFHERDGMTEVSMTFNATPVTFMAKIMSVVFGFMCKSLAKMVAKDLDDLAVCAEKAGHTE